MKQECTLIISSFEGARASSCPAAEGAPCRVSSRRCGGPPPLPSAPSLPSPGPPQTALPPTRMSCWSSHRRHHQSSHSRNPPRPLLPHRTQSCRPHRQGPRPHSPHLPRSHCRCPGGTSRPSHRGRPRSRCGSKRASCSSSSQHFPRYK